MEIQFNIDAIEDAGWRCVEGGCEDEQELRPQDPV